MGIEFVNIIYRITSTCSLPTTNKFKTGNLRVQHCRHAVCIFLHFLGSHGVALEIVV